MNRKSASLLALLLSVMLFVLPAVPGSTTAVWAKPPTATPPPPPSTINSIIPMPVSVTATGGTFTLPATADIYVNPNSAEMIAIGQYLANKLNPSTGYGLTVIGTTSTPPSGNIYLTTVGGSSSLGTEGYDLSVTTSLVTLTAYQPNGVFHGLQTIRQMFPPAIEKSTVQAGPWTMPTGTIHDLPRFAYRGHMLDVVRHFFTVAEVKREIDGMAYYKLNYFHIHLGDDQGYRIVINGWPNLTDYGSQTEVAISGRNDGTCLVADDGGPCYYTQAQYTDIVNYAAARYITVVPEVDSPGHTNAALASYASLNCNGIAPARRTDTAVGYSTLCVTQPIPAATTNYNNAVIDQLSALTPGPYIHIGGDESNATALADYENFVSVSQARVIADGKKMMGWEETAQISDYSSTSIAQHWNTTASFAPNAVSHGAKVVMSPCPHAYLDIMYSRNGGPSGLGLHWCGYDSVQNSYSWDPATLVAGVPEASVLGVEGPLWGETILTTSDIDQLAWPRLAGLAELGWSPVAGRSWSEYSVRLGSHGPRLTNMGINFFRSTEVPWQ